MYFRKKKESINTFIGLALISIFACASMWITKKISYAGDTRSHLQRIQGIYTGLRTGQFPVIIYPNQVGEFGQLGILYPNVFLYIPAFLRLAGVSMFSSYKLFDSLVGISAMLAAYATSKKFITDYKLVLLSTALYTLCNSRFRVQTYGCTAGYGVAMIFIPFIVYGIYSLLYEDKKRWEYLAIGFMGVVSSHVITTVVTVIVIFVFVLMNLKRFFRRETLIAVLKALISFILMTLMVTVPFIHYYRIGINKSNLSWSSFIESRWSLLQMLIPDNQMTELIMVILVVLLVLISGNFISFIKDEFYVKSFVLYILFTWMETTLFPWKILDELFGIDKILSSIQQADRIRYSTLFFIIIVFVHVLEKYTFPDTNKNRIKYLASGVAVACILITTTKYYSLYSNLSEELPGINDYVTGTIESKVDADYLPAGTEPSYYEYAVGKVSDESIVTSYEYEKNGTNIRYVYSSAGDGEYADFPLLYYDGYQAMNESGDKLNIEKSDMNRVIVYLPKAEAKTEINVSFKVVAVFLICVIISVLSISAVVALSIVNDKRSVAKICAGHNNGD